MFLSIIIPIYNDEQYLEECLNSCLQNNLSADEYEIICVDDGSTDKTPEILRRYEKEFSNIRIIFRKHGNGGRAVGYEIAKGDYIWFVDHDDIVAPGAVDKLLSIVKNHKDYDRISFPCYEFFYSLTKEEKEAIANQSLHAAGGEYVQILYVWSSIIKKSFLELNQIKPWSKRIELAREYWDIPLTRVWGADNVFMEECFDKGITTFEMKGSPLYFYRRNDNSESMKLSKPAKDKRMSMLYNTAMVRAYNAMMLRDKYMKERELLGHATEETTTKMIVKYRFAMMKLATLSNKYWKEGLTLLNSKDFFLAKKPEEYCFTLGEYLRKMRVKDRIHPRSIASYYLFTLKGAKWYRVLSFLDRSAVNSEILTKLYRIIKAKRLRRKALK